MTRNVATQELQISGNGRVIQRSLDLSGSDLAQISGSIRHSTGVGSDQMAIEVFDGSAWRSVQTVSASVGTSFVSFNTNITQDINPGFAVRILGLNNLSNRFFAVDFIEISTTLQVCFSDNFSSATLSAADWSTSSVSGGFGQPVIQSGRLRLTNASPNVSTAASLNRFFPGANNRIVIEFDYLGYGGNGADVVAVTLSDGAVNPVPGGFGGSLGYAQRSGINGFAGGWLGVGFDEFGNFSSPSEGRLGGLDLERMLWHCEGLAIIKLGILFCGERIH